MKILNIVILLFYIYLITCVLKPTEYMLIGLVTCILLLYLYLDNKYSKVEGYILDTRNNPKPDCENDKCYHKTYDEVLDNKTNSDNNNNLKYISSLRPRTNKVSGKMSNLDGICMSTGNKDSWMKSPSNISLNSNNGLYTVQGSNLPPKPIISDPTSLSGPPIDGVDGSPNKLFMLANNKVSPDCCPSTFSTSTGCLCTTEQQRKFVNTRGNNISGCNNSL